MTPKQKMTMLLEEKKKIAPSFCQCKRKYKSIIKNDWTWVCYRCNNPKALLSWDEWEWCYTSSGWRYEGGYWITPKGRTVFRPGGKFL